MSQVAKQCLSCRRSRATAICQCCGNRFDHVPSRPRAACSRDCAYKLRGKSSGNSQSRKVSLVCEYCGRIKQVSPVYAERRYCSRDCSSRARSGSGNQNWKGGITSSISLSTQAKNGATSALKSGVEREASASDAVIGANLAKFTTSALGLLIPISGSTVATSLCSVLAAISGCIPSETLPERFSLLLELESPYTLIPWRGKPAEECPDGPRYKAIGNSKAVPVVRWIGRRIQRELERAP